MKTGIILSVAVIWFVFTGVAGSEVELIGSCHLNGAALDVFVVDSYAYVVGFGIGIQVIDVSDPTSPTTVGSEETSGASHNVVVEGKYAYAANRSSGLEIFDISVPSNPVFIAGYDPPTLGHDVFHQNGIVYFISCRYFSVLEVFDPLHPTLIGELHRQSGDFSEFSIAGIYAFVVDYYFTSGLTTINILDPTNPQISGSYPDLNSPSDIFILGDFAYIPTENGLRVLNVSDPANPYLISSFDSTRIGWRIFCADDFAFLADQNSGLLILDISDPYDPDSVENFSSYGYNDVFYYQNLIYTLRGNYMDILLFSQTDINQNLLPPENIYTFQTYPNPFNTSTTIRYYLSEKSEITLSIYNLLGQKIKTLFERVQNPGEHAITWDASRFPSGIYFARLKTAGRTENIKMVLLK